MQAVFRVTCATVLTGFLQALIPGSCLGTSVLPLTLKDTIDLSAYVFAGSVKEITYTRSSYGELITRVAFGDLAFAKGSYDQPQIIVTLSGGREGESEEWVVGVPSFTKGSRYIVFLDKWLGSEEDAYLPIVGAWQGCFSVHPASRSGFVSDWSGRPVVDVKEGRIVVLGDPASVAPDDTARGTFIEYIHTPPDSARLQLPPGPAGVAHPPAHPPNPSTVSGKQSRESSLLTPEQEQRIQERDAARRPSTSHASPQEEAKVREILSRPPGNTVRALRPMDDPGTRVSEARFLAILQSMR